MYKYKENYTGSVIKLTTYVNFIRLLVNLYQPEGSLYWETIKFDIMMFFYTLKEN
ncbi:hypothetical protein AM1BK_21980 [Neobacillus kokaensis]|uniref:Uncharacterized protein n=1 Tax=Neobacillus kokaensis TaxID=2759023 RepID=A0ABQ3N483_9BACI|nr:hypothetical protein AM1BK_21980 [Neobacillus kokaensis]